jgi:P-type Mg2+ transporter
VASLDQARPPLAAMDLPSLTLAAAAALPADDVLARLTSSAAGLSRDEASARLAEVGANALRSHVVQGGSRCPDAVAGPLLAHRRRA